MVMYSIDVDTTGVGVGVEVVLSTASEGGVDWEVEEGFWGWFSAGDEVAVADEVAAGCTRVWDAGLAGSLDGEGRFADGEVGAAADVGLSAGAEEAGRLV